MKSFGIHILAAGIITALAILSGTEADCRPTLDEKLGEYLHAIRREPVEVQCSEADFLISACTDSVVRQNVAERIFRHYINTGIMGLEAVAVHVFDKWFSDGPVKMKNREEFLAAKIFADFNRQSLIGRKAPELSLRDTSGNAVTLFRQKTGESAQKGDASSNGRWSILYFYDTGCPKCIAESIMLENILENDNFDADFYAICTQDSRDRWTEWISGHFNLPEGSNTRVFHLWDPEMSSGFQIRYGILETPRIFLVGPDGIICGRGLDSVALEELMTSLLTPPSPAYGSDDSYAFYERVFSAYGDRISCGEIAGIADHIAERTLEDAHDTLLFKQMAGDLLYYFPMKRGSVYKCAEEYLIRNHIFGHDDIWNTPDDTLKVIGFAQIRADLLGRAAAGTRIPDIKVRGTLKKNTGRRTSETSGKMNLRKLCNDRTVIIFYTAGCDICKGEIAAADSLLAAEAQSGRDNRTALRTGVFMINMDEVSATDPETASLLLDTFDLTVLPYITEIDRKGIIRDKYMSLRSRRENRP